MIKRVFCTGRDTASLFIGVAVMQEMCFAVEDENVSLLCRTRILEKKFFGLQFDKL